MTVRCLRVDEITTLVEELWLPFAREMAELDPYNELAEAVRADALRYRREQRRNDDVATFVADGDGRLVGYVVVAYGEPPPVFARGPAATVEELYVRPDHRGEGTATGLLDRAEAWARERGCERVALSVNADNEAARRLYERRGYAVRRLKMDKPFR